MGDLTCIGGVGIPCILGTCVIFRIAFIWNRCFSIFIREGVSANISGDEIFRGMINAHFTSSDSKSKLFVCLRVSTALVIAIKSHIRCNPPCITFPSFQAS
jgi:hypothetical protein